MSRFDYIKYDKESVTTQLVIKEICEALEAKIEALDSPRAKSIALTKLEECYAWVGKAIRDDQIHRNGYGETKEERTNA